MKGALLGRFSLHIFFKDDGGDAETMKFETKSVYADQEKKYDLPHTSAAPKNEKVTIH